MRSKKSASRFRNVSLGNVKNMNTVHIKSFPNHKTHGASARHQLRYKTTGVVLFTSQLSLTNVPNHEEMARLS